MMFKTINTYFKQFGFLNTIGYLLVGIFNRIFDRHKIASYSQGGEDRIIGAILSGIDHGFYVDVGCNHPQHYSNTFALYKRGWTGINIDANSQLIKKHQKLKKRDISICAVVSNEEKEAIFTEFNDSLVSSLNPKHIDKWKKRRTIKNQRTVNTLSLTKILQQYKAPNQFDLLSIDVEGHDLEVLCSLDLNIYRPKLIVVEMNKIKISHLDSHPIYSYLNGHDYEMIGYIGLNGYFKNKKNSRNKT